MTRPVGVGVVGLGLMGRVHIEAYTKAAAEGHACRLVAVSDHSPERLTGRTQVSGNLQSGGEALLFDPQQVTTGTDPAVVFTHPEVELVSICTPTPTHVSLALQALAHGKHVLLEKPVSLDPDEIERLAQAAQAAQRWCIPAMCMRHWPGWDLLRAVVQDQRYGALQALSFRRLGARPTWGAGFYDDSQKTGGALCDLHVHDADLVQWIVGVPDAVRTVGTLDHHTTTYHYARGPRQVLAEGGWLAGGSVPFRMCYLAEFEQATIEYDLRRTPPLEISHAGQTQSIDPGTGTGYDGEVRNALAVVRGTAQPAATLKEAASVMRMLRDERRSLES